MAFVEASRPLVAAITFIIFFTLVSSQHRDTPTIWNASLSSTSPTEFSLFRRLDPGRCDADTPCVGGECCDAQSGYCGLDAEHCDPSVCTSNCKARAECGSWAETPGQECPLKVCCSNSGYCGVTEEFCDTSLGCQSNCPQPPSTGLNTGNVTNIVIGYYESWAPYKRGACPSRDPSWIKTDSITHLYVAFAYIRPSTYDIVPIDGTGTDIITEIMALKESAPGLKIFLSLGGWTYSDNGTDTQPVWGDLASSSAKRQKFILSLVNFMTQFGFDGVDLDWEYPGAPDRGGQDRDTANYVSLLKDIRTWWTAQSNGWGLSFTAPTSYWYLRWFDIENMAKSVDWVNLMTYDLHGSWDSPEDQIGSYVYSHTNLTEIEAALNLLWRNNVPANKVNLGLGFYGRSYTLEDPSCTLPGCPFTSGGLAGACSGQSGILSYDEITQIASTYNIDPVEDDKAASMYFAFGKNQWVSYDSVKTIKEKVDYANKKGLLGLFIWALDLDNSNYEALAAVLDSRGGLGTFGAQNGVGPSSSTDWQPMDGACHLSDCSGSSACTGDYISVGPQLKCDNDNQHRWVCCPRNNAPDAKTCQWKASFQSWEGVTSAPCVDTCSSDQILLVQSQWYVEDNQGDKKCSSGTAQYCCDADENANQACGMLTGICIGNGDPNHFPEVDPSDDICDSVGRKYVTFSQDTCAPGTWRPWCCDKEYDASQCKWQGPSEDGPDSVQCLNAKNCPNMINLGVSKEGGGSDCMHQYYDSTPVTPWYGLPYYIMPYERALCCPVGDQVIYKKTSPVPLAWLFVDTVPDSDTQDFQLDVESDVNANEDPNENGFGWVIMTGPQKDLASLDKRDGSHWELYDCPDRSSMTEDSRVTVRAVCTDDSDDSNCHTLFLGGVPETVIEMPPHCGIGRYAMAVSMEPAADQNVSRTLARRLIKRESNLQRTPTIYDFTFDYDFSILHGRDSSDVQIRIDYSEDPGYWKAFVDNAPGSDPLKSKHKRDIELEVERKHGGSWKRYANHMYREGKRETPDHLLHEFHKRWTDPSEEDWMKFMEALNEKQFDQEVNLGTHHITNQIPFYLFNENLQCTLLGLPYTAYLTVWADLHVDIQTSAQLTLIGRLNDLTSFKQSHVLVRNKGSIQTGLHMEAQGQMRFSTGRVELFGLPNFAGSFQVPGIVTIGPNLRITGELTGIFTVHTQAHYNLEVSEWDYTQRYPNPNNDVLSGLTPTSKMDDQPGAEIEDDKKGFSADIGVEGDLTLKITPLVDFGIRWNPKYKVQDTAISLQLATYATLYGSAGIGTSDTQGSVCYGAVCGAELFAQLEGPTIFGVDPNRRWSFYKNDFNLIPESCQPLTNFLPSKCDDC
ncbi:family 18 glycosyl hydrolase [Annulohypoxylon bovei var. microspora]|nr:family 18 glycosyl hydrolase [Annulohypoxylon bovei var. microspora]